MIEEYDEKDYFQNVRHITIPNYYHSHIHKYYTLII